MSAVIGSKEQMQSMDMTAIACAAFSKSGVISHSQLTLASKLDRKLLCYVASILAMQQFLRQIGLDSLVKFASAPNDHDLQCWALVSG